jgi:hypothetical protein
VWAPDAEVIGAEVAVGARGAALTAHLAAGEDARARLCVYAASLVDTTTERCRSVAVAGLRPQEVPMRAPAGTSGRVEVAVRFSAESNRSRRTFVIRQAVLKRWP